MAQIQLTIDDLYGMLDTTQAREPWYAAPSVVIRRVFAMEGSDILVTHDVDEPHRDPAFADASTRIMVHAMMGTSLNDECRDGLDDECRDGKVGIFVLTLDKAPFGVFIWSADAGDDQSELLVTDEDLYRSAIELAELSRKRPTFGSLVDRSCDLVKLMNSPPHKARDGDSRQQYVIAKDNNGFRLQPGTLVDGDGFLLFDRIAFRSELWKAIRYFKETDKDVDWILSKAADLVAGAIPDGIGRFVVNEPPQDDFIWVAAVAGTDEGSYAIGAYLKVLKKYGLEHGENIVVKRLGGPHLFAELKKCYASGTIEAGS